MGESHYLLSIATKYENKSHGVGIVSYQRVIIVLEVPSYSVLPIIHLIKSSVGWLQAFSSLQIIRAVA